MGRKATSVGFVLETSKSFMYLLLLGQDRIAVDLDDAVLLFILSVSQTLSPGLMKFQGAGFCTHLWTCFTVQLGFGLTPRSEYLLPALF